MFDRNFDFFDKYFNVYQNFDFDQKFRFSTKTYIFDQTILNSSLDNPRSIQMLIRKFRHRTNREKYGPNKYIHFLRRIKYNAMVHILPFI